MSAIRMIEIALGIQRSGIVVDFVVLSFLWYCVSRRFQGL